MKLKWMLVVIGLTLFTLISLVPDAQAKKMGGGLSLGRQSNTISRNQGSLPPKPVAPPVNSSGASKPGTSTPTAPPAAPSRFGGMGGILGGIAAGIGLSYLFSSLGMGAGVGSFLSNILLIGITLFLGLWLYRKFMAAKSVMSAGEQSSWQPVMTPSTANASNYSESTVNSLAAPLQKESSSNQKSIQAIGNQNQMPLIPEVSSTNVHAPIDAQLTPGNWPDKESFLESAKTLFLQLQEASDTQNIEVLKEFTTPELFTLLRHDMLSRKEAFSETQVLTLAADLLAVEEDQGEYLASVRFSGSLREERNGPVEDFEEVWNWLKPVQGNSGWLLSGIQQIN